MAEETKKYISKIQFESDGDAFDIKDREAADTPISDEEIDNLFSEG
jgi:hypothetical protein